MGTSSKRKIRRIVVKKRAGASTVDETQKDMLLAESDKATVDAAR